MDVLARSCGQPLSSLLDACGSVAIQNEMDFQAGSNGLVGPVEKSQELLMPVPRLALSAMRLLFCFFQIWCTVAGLSFCAAAAVRTLHDIASFGVIFIVFSTIAVSCSAEIRLGRSLRGRSSRIPAIPTFSNRFRHNSTVGTVVDSDDERAPSASN